MTAPTALEIRLRRTERNIHVQKCVRRQIKSRHESTAEIDHEIAVLKLAAKDIRRQLKEPTNAPARHHRPISRPSHREP